MLLITQLLASFHCVKFVPLSYFVKMKLIASRFGLWESAGLPSPCYNAEALFGAFKLTDLIQTCKSVYGSGRLS